MKDESFELRKSRYLPPSGKVKHRSFGSGVLGEDDYHRITKKVQRKFFEIARKRFLKRVGGICSVNNYDDPYGNMEIMYLMFENQVQATLLASRTDFNNVRYDLVDFGRAWWDYPHIAEMVNARCQNLNRKTVNYKRLRNGKRRQI